MTITTNDLRAISTCCYNGAAMLEIADTGETSDAKRMQYRKLNQGQASLLRQAAAMAEAGAMAVENKLQPDKSEMARATVDLFGYMLRGELIGAIKAYRTLTGDGLKESKAAVESIMHRLKQQDAA